MADLSGERLGPFEIRSLLGTGGFATVYRAHDPRLDADVAIKILAENHALDPAARGRFIAEAHALRRVDSPAVIRIHDIRETPDARPYLVLDLAERGDLAARRRSRVVNGWSPTGADLRAVVDALTEALGAMHAAQLVHRDITPANLLLRVRPRVAARPGVTLLEPDEAIVVSDMGLVKDMSSGGSMTMGGGTAGFWAPEQRQALTKVDRRTDVYAATAVVIWLLTGEATTTAPDWPRRLAAAGWPAALVHHLERGVAIDPNDRPSTIDSWAHAINGAVSALGAPTPRAAPPQSPAPSPAPTPPAAPPHSQPPSPAPMPRGGFAPVEPRSSNAASSLPRRSLLAGSVAAVAALALVVLFLLLQGGADSDPVAEPGPVATVSASPTGTNNDDADDDPPTGDESPTIERNATESTESTIAAWTRQTWVLSTHPSGSQLVVRSVDTTPERTRVSIELLNGRDFTTVFRARDADTALVAPDGSVSRLLESAEITLDHGERGQLELDFSPTPDGGTLALHVRQPLDVATGVVDESTPTEDAAPGFSALIPTGTTSAPATPGALSVHDVATHPNGTTVRVDAVSIDDDAIRIALRAVNPDSLRVNVSSGHESSFVEDDLGNRYRLRFDGDNRTLRVDGEGRSEGTLVFSGRLDPSATTIALVLNGDDSADDPATSQPKLVLGPWPVDRPSMIDIAVAPLAINATATHPTGLTVTVGDADVTDDTVRAQVTIDNRFRRAVFLNACCDQSYIRDDLGSRLALIGPDGNESIRVVGETAVSGELVFVGGLSSDATSFEFVFNADGDASADTGTPLVVLGPFEITRDDSLQVDGVVEAGADRTIWVEQTAPRSELD